MENLKIKMAGVCAFLLLCLSACSNLLAVRDVPTEPDSQVQSLQSQSYREIPISEQNVLLETDESGLTIRDKDNQILAQIDTATVCLRDGVSDVYSMMVMPRDSVIAVRAETDDTDVVLEQVGLYSLSDCTWVVSPVYNRIQKVSDSLYIATGEYGEVLMRANGEQIGTSEYPLDGDGNCYLVKGDYVCDWHSIYDLQGNLVATYDGVLSDIWDDKILLYMDSGNSQFRTIDGKVIWEIGAKYVSEWRNRCGSYLNGYDREGGGVIIDENLNTLITDELFFRENPDVTPRGTGIMVEAESPDKSQLIVSLTAMDGEMYYFKCDKEFSVISTYTNELQIAEGDGSVWSWEIQTPQLIITNVWTGETYAIDGVDESFRDVWNVDSFGSVLCVVYRNAGMICQSVCFLQKEIVYSLSGYTYYLMDVLNENLAAISWYEEAAGMYSNLYLTREGEVLEGNKLLQVLAENNDIW